MHCSFAIFIFCLGSLNLILVSGQDDCDAIRAICPGLIENATKNYPSYKDLRTPDLIKRLGYPVETHETTTEDGYILTTYRIPYTNKSTATRGKIPILVMHGMLASSVQWLWQPPNRALVFMLADAGYDVWIGNARGTTYSLGHTSRPSNSTTDLRYWDFSYHEMAFYDLPATINDILQKTGQPSLYYVGHSIGTLQFFVGIMLRPELGSKVRTMFSLSTSGFISQTNNAVFRAQSTVLAPYAIERIANQARGGKMDPSITLPFIGDPKLLCETFAIECAVCNTAFGLQYGFDPCQTDFEQFPGFANHLPDITSMRVFSHVAQNVIYNTVRQYDYGIFENPSKYGGARTPPDYDFSKYNVPTVIYYGDRDSICVPEDVQRTVTALGSNVKESNRVAYPQWTHMDNVVAKDADKYVYNYILDIINTRKYG